MRKEQQGILQQRQAQVLPPQGKNRSAGNVSWSKDARFARHRVELNSDIISNVLISRNRWYSSSLRGLKINFHSLDYVITVGRVLYSRCPLRIEVDNLVKA